MVLNLDTFHPDAVLATGPDASREPVLRIDQIQGNIFPGFGTSRQRLFGLQIASGAEGAASARAWLRMLAPRVTTLAQMQGVREVRRAVARASGIRPALPDVLLNVALSFPALELLGLPTDRIRDTPFRQGMASTSLQDPVDAEGRLVGWRLGSTPETTAHVLVILGSDSAEALQTAGETLLGSLAPGMTCFYDETGERLPESAEHFGFRDDISQPGVRGRLSDRPDHVLTRRYFDPADPRAEAFARPGQPLLWPGEFLFGYVAQRADGELEPGAMAIPPHPWMQDGSFLIFRRLRQDVRVFRQFAETQAPQISAQLGRPVSPAELQAWIVGRWPDGTPLARSPNGPDAATAKDRMAVNFFDYVSGEPSAQVIENGQARTVPGIPDDDRGLNCPHFAHIRKVNLRNKLTDQGPSLNFRLLRRGIPFGPLYQDGEPAGTERGLLFLAYQRRIDPPLLTLTSTWMNAHDAPEGFGHDLLVGQNPAGRSAQRLNAEGQIIADLSSPAGEAWVIPTGGGFFFSPAKSVLETL